MARQKVRLMCKNQGLKMSLVSKGRLELSTSFVLTVAENVRKHRYSTPIKDQEDFMPSVCIHCESAHGYQIDILIVGAPCFRKLHF